MGEQSLEHSARPTLPETQKNWGDLLKRMIRRREIAKALQQTGSFAKISNGVREFEKTNQVNELVESLITSEVMVDPQRASLATELSVQLKKRYPKISNLAVVLVGSSVHGGAVVRRVMETENDSQADIDWAVLYDKQPGSRPPFLDISIVGGGIIEKIIRKTLIPGNLSPCSQTDPEFCHAENLANTPQALELVEQARTLFDYQSLLLYLLPSYPPETNQQNRKSFLEALSSLAKENPDLWKEQVDKLFKEWEFQHLIKFKHLISLSSPERDTSLAHQVETLSEKVMPLAIKTLLYSTKI